MMHSASLPKGSSAAYACLSTQQCCLRRMPIFKIGMPTLLEEAAPSMVEEGSCCWWRCSSKLCCHRERC